MKEETVKFGLMSDLHMDIMHDGPERLTQFLRACEEENVDFIINNGDFCYPRDTSKSMCSKANMPVNLKNAMEISTPVPKLEMLAKFNTYAKPHYHVLGNHEMDFCSKEETIELYGMPHAYYNFHHNGWHFLVLDPNHFKDEDGELKDYYYGNYFDHHDDLPYLDEEQLRWMKQVMMECPEPVVIFSHQPLYPVSRGVKNYDRLKEVFDEVRKEDPGKIRMCIYGHVHLDQVTVNDGIIHYSVNSMSNHWIGTRYACHRFSEDIERQFPNLQYVFPYKEPLFAIVTLDREGVSIQGKTGQFFEPVPEKIGFDEYEVSASIQNRNLKWVR